MSEENAPEVDAPEVDAPEVEVEEVDNSVDVSDVDAIVEGDEIPSEEEEGFQVDEETQDNIVEKIRQLSLKVNGVESIEELPFDIDPEHVEYLQRKFQMAAAGQGAMREKAEFEKKYNSQMNSLKENPWEAIEELGLDADELMEMRMQQRIEDMKKSPEQLQAESNEKELIALREQLSRQEEDKKVANQQKLDDQAKVEVTSQIEAAISSATTLPNTAGVRQKFVDHMLYYMDNGYPDVTAEQVAGIVEKDITEEYQNMVETMPDKVLEAFMGKKVMERLRKQRLSAAKKTPETKIEEISKQQLDKKKPKKKFNMNDFLSKPISELK